MKAYHSVVSKDANCILQQAIPWECLRGKTVLITGANGAVPAYLVYTLVLLNQTKEMNIKILGLVRNRKKAEERFADLLESPYFHLIVQDVCDPMGWQGAIDYIVHAASNTTPSVFLNDPVDTLNGNIKGTINILETARKKNSIGIVYVSSDSVYGYSLTEKLRSEMDFSGTDCSDISNCYIESKRAGEMLCAAYHHQYGVPATSVRLSSVLVPGLYVEKNSHLAEFSSTVARGNRITLKSKGLSLRTYMPIQDVVTGVFLALVMGKRGEAYNVVHEDCVCSIYDMAKMFMRLSGNDESVVLDIDTHQANTITKDRHFCDCGQKLRSLGWKPNCDVENAVSSMIEVARYAEFK